jgi:hypothetical protein
MTVISADRLWRIAGSIRARLVDGSVTQAINDALEWATWAWTTSFNP